MFYFSFVVLLKKNAESINPLTMRNRLDVLTCPQTALLDEVLEDIDNPVNKPEIDVGPAIEAGADACYVNNLPSSVIALLLSALLRCYTEYSFSPQSAQ